MAGYQGSYGNTPIQSGLTPPQYEKSGFNPLKGLIDLIRGQDPSIPPSTAQALAEHIMSQQGSPAMGRVGQSTLADRAPAEMSGSAAADSAQAPMSPFEALLAQAMGGTSKSAVRATIAPERAAVAALQQQLGQVGAQTDQNVADINSWFGQLGSSFGKNARRDTKSSRKAARGDTRTARGLMAGVADPNVAASIARTGQRGAHSLRAAGLEQGAFDRHQANDAAEQGAYQALVQQRLGMQAETDIRGQLAQAQAAKVAAKQEAKSGDMGQLLQVLGLLGQDARDQYLMTGQVDPSVLAGDSGPSDLERGSAIQSALGSTPFFGSDASGGMPSGGLQDILKQAYGAVAARLGPDAINDPEVQQSIRAYVQSHVAQQYNSKMGTNWHLNGPGSFFTQQ